MPALVRTAAPDAASSARGIEVIITGRFSGLLEAS